LLKKRPGKRFALGHVGTISDGTAFFQYMAVHEFISHVGVDVQAKFAKDNLRQLLNEDEYPDLTKTLRIFLQCGGQVTQAARKLFIHRNTLNYRLEKISLLLGCDVRDAQNQFTLSLALLAGLLSGVVQE
jgi:purine catabolism regulator